MNCSTIYMKCAHLWVYVFNEKINNKRWMPIWLYCVEIYYDDTWIRYKLIYIYYFTNLSLHKNFVLVVLLLYYNFTPFI